MGIIHSIIRWVLCWRGSVEELMLIFCWAHMLAPESRGRIAVLSGLARSIQRKPRFTGTALCSTGSQE